MVSSGGGPPLQEQSPAISPFVGSTPHYFATLLWAAHCTTLPHFCGQHTTLLCHNFVGSTPHYSTTLLWAIHYTSGIHTAHLEYFSAVLDTNFCGDQTTEVNNTQVHYWAQATQIPHKIRHTSRRLAVTNNSGAIVDSWTLPTHIDHPWYNFATLQTPKHLTQGCKRLDTDPHAQTVLGRGN